MKIDLRKEVIANQQIKYHRFVQTHLIFFSVFLGKKSIFVKTF
jgi:hypothetical protein